MSYEEVMALKPFISESHLNMFYVLMFVLAIFLFVGLTIKLITSIGTDDKVKTTKYSFVCLILLVSFTMFLIKVNKLEEKNKNWETDYVIPYIEGQQQFQTNKIYELDLINSETAYVQFSHEKELININADIIFENDIDEAYVSYYFNSERFNSNFNENQVVLVNVHLPN